ncbi:MAG: hypothetical protein PHD67_06890 [Oscillospiraceae bacterium]|nr:hypothetical protein [Oscillospiraceae bacterium]
MKTTLELHLRTYPIEAVDTRTGEHLLDTITLDKTSLQAAQVVGADDKALIYSQYNRHGYRVLNIGKPTKRTVAVDLGELAAQQGGAE